MKYQKLFNKLHELGIIALQTDMQEIVQIVNEMQLEESASMSKISGEEIEEPTGNFILENLAMEKRFQTVNGMYVHYADVCTLLKNYHKYKLKKINKPKCNNTDNEKREAHLLLGKGCNGCEFRREIACGRCEELQAELNRCYEAMDAKKGING